MSKVLAFLKQATKKYHLSAYAFPSKLQAILSQCFWWLSNSKIRFLFFLLAFSTWFSYTESNQFLGFIFFFCWCWCRSSPDTRGLSTSSMSPECNSLENSTLSIISQLLSEFHFESFCWFLGLLLSIFLWLTEWFWWLSEPEWLVKRVFSKFIPGYSILFPKSTKIWNQHSFIP